MSIVGIIAEYNPFHQGHLFHLNEAKKISSAQGVICAMSGNFVQRGEPALVNKWARAEMALSQGVDVVLELPVLYATRSAYWFARGGVELLYNTGIVSHLAFGVETDQPFILDKASDVLSQEPPSFKSDLKLALKAGDSYPRARAQALAKIFPHQQYIWHKPNNNLALSYLQVIKEKQIPLIPVMIKRQGLEYNDEILSSGTLPSASAIRNYINKNILYPENSQTPDLNNVMDNLAQYLPPAIMEILLREFTGGRGPVNLETLENNLMLLLRQSSPPEIKNIVDIREGLENRILAIAQKETSLRGFLSQVKNKRVTYTRIQRFLIHLLLNYTKDKELFLKEGPPYLRVLGFTSRGRTLIKEMNAKSGIPLITKCAHYRRHYLENTAFNVSWDMDILATNIYSLLFPRQGERIGGLDYFKGPVFLEN